MSNTPSQPSQPTQAGNPLTRPTLAFLALVTVAALGAFALHLWGPPQGAPTPREVDLRVPDWRPTPAELQAIAKARAARLTHAPAKDDPDAAALVKAYEAFSRAERAGHGRAPQGQAATKLAEAHAVYAQRARDMARFKSLERFLGLGQALADQLLSALSEGDTATVERLGGRFMDEGRATGLLGPHGKPAAGAEPIIAAAFLLRWVSALAEERPVEQLLTLEERRILARWKLGANPLLPPERRAAVAEELRRLQPDYPATEALVARAADDSDWEEAARLYGEALRERPGDRRLRANETFATERARLRAAGAKPRAR